MLSQLRPAIISMVFFTALLGLGYPLAVTGFAQAAFPVQANGSLITNGSGKSVGSELIGQPFAQARYLHPRPSAAGKGYDGAASSGSSYEPLNDDYIARVKSDADALRADSDRPVPVDAVTTSGSRLDPHISPAYAERQVQRIADTRGVAPARVRAVIAGASEGPTLGFLGQARVNVLKVNLALDARLPAAHPPAP